MTCSIVWAVAVLFTLMDNCNSHEKAYNQRQDLFISSHNYLSTTQQITNILNWQTKSFFEMCIMKVI